MKVSRQPRGENSRCTFTGFKLFHLPLFLFRFGSDEPVYSLYGFRTHRRKKPLSESRSTLHTRLLNGLIFIRGELTSETAGETVIIKTITVKYNHQPCRLKELSFLRRYQDSPQLLYTVFFALFSTSKTPKTGFLSSFANTNFKIMLFFPQHSANTGFRIL